MYCPQCGKKITGYPKYCRYCGSLLSEESAWMPGERNDTSVLYSSEHGKTEKEKRRHNGVKTFLTILAGILLAILLIFLDKKHLLFPGEDAAESTACLTIEVQTGSGFQS